MSETETTTEAPAPKKKQVRKKQVRRAAAAPPAPAKATPFPGLTQNDCATTCTGARCAISGNGICGHPCKGAVTPPGDGAALNRLRAAQKQLGIEKVEKRYA